MSDLFDVVIVGGGPTGLFAAYYAGFRAMKVKIIDNIHELGGQITALYPEKFIFDVAGFPRISGKDLVKNLCEQALQYKPEVCLNEMVQEIQRGPNGSEKQILLKTNKGEHLTKVVILTAGVGMFKPKKVPVPGAENFEGKGLVYFVKKLEDFRDKKVMILGGGDSAVDWVLNLLPVAQSVTLVHRRDGFRAHEDSVAQMKASRAVIKVFYELKSIEGSGKVEKVRIFNNKTQQEETVPIDAIVACLGFETDLGPLSHWGLEMEGRSVKVNTRMETNIPGVYAAGDLVGYPGKVKLIATGFGEAATAVNNAAAYINPNASVFPGHSSEAVKK